MRQPLRMLLALEDLAPIGAFALKNGTRIMQPMGEDVNLRLRSGHQSAVEPDHAFHLIEGHRHGRSSVVAFAFGFPPLLRRA